MNNNENLNNGNLNNNQPLENNLNGVNANSNNINLNNGQAMSNINSQPENNMGQNIGVVNQPQNNGVNMVNNNPNPNPTYNSVPPMNSSINSNGENNPDANKKIKPMYIIAALVVLVVIVGGYFAFSTFSGSYETPVNNYCKLMQTFDVSLIDKLVPKEVINTSDYNSLVEYINDEKDYIKDFNGKFEINCDIQSAEKLDAEDLKDINDDFKEKYNSKRKVSQAYDIEFKMNMSLEYNGNTTTNDDTEYLTVGKIGTKWYVVDF